MNVTRKEDEIMVVMATAELFLLHQMAIEVMMNKDIYADKELEGFSNESSGSSLARFILGITQKAYDIEGGFKTVMTFIGREDLIH